MAEKDKEKLQKLQAKRKEVNKRKNNRKKAARRKATMAENKKKTVKAPKVKQARKTSPVSNPNSLDPRIELAKRVLARRHILPFTQMFTRNYIAGWVHKDICERLERFYHAVQAGSSPRLLLFMPPRTGKSELASVNFPAWALGQDPTLELIATSYAVSLASVFSRKARDRIKLDKRYHTLFPQTRIAPSQENIEHWGTTEGGAYVAAGIGGPITGKGFKIGIIDDPVKNQEEADSETIQVRNWEWYQSTFRTRAAPGAGILGIQTRWAFDDLAGMLIQQMEKGIAGGEDVEDWEIVVYPALAEHDEYIDLTSREIIRDPAVIHENMRLLRHKHEALHPARYDEKELRRTRNSVGLRIWSALYQQSPLPESGDYFKRPWFQTSTPPGFLGMYNIMAGDLALGKKEHNHHSAFVIASVDMDGRIYIREVLFGKWSTHELVELILDQQEEYNLHCIGLEQGSTFLAIQDQLNLRMRERGVYPTFDDELKPVTDKRVRARPIQGLMQAGNVFWPEHNPWWVAPAQTQLLRFDAAQDDDIVDAFAWLGRMYHHVGRPEQPRHKSRQKSWKDQLRKHIRRGKRRSAMAA
jgi:predicted phage terminase large subunit-like protein